MGVGGWFGGWKRYVWLLRLEIKYLKDYPTWQFLSDNELNRKTIEVFKDIKKAKINCNKDQKVINVPNTNVFKVAKFR